MTTHTNSSAATPKNAPRSKRHNIILATETAGKGEKLAQIEKRSFSNLLEVLIDREFERQGLDKAPTAEVGA